MNRIEHLLMNNPVRAAIQRRYAAPLLARLAGEPLARRNRAFEIGCGNGLGLEIIKDQFGFAEVEGSDLDPIMVKKAERRCQKVAGLHVREGSAQGILAEDARYDAVFGFGIIHHIPAWREAISEVKRVLRPGGLFYSEESFAPFIEHPIWRRLLDHPPERFHAEHYIEALKSEGFTLRGVHLSRGEGLGWLVAEKAG